MTKTSLTTLILVMLSVAISVIWFLMPPSTMLFNNGAEREQTQRASLVPGESPPQLGLDVAVQSSSIDTGVPTARAAGSSARAPSKAGFATPGRRERSASALQEEEQPRKPSIAGLVQDEDGHPLGNIEVLAESISLPDTDKSKENLTPAAARSTLTDFDGFFYFANLSDNEYRIYAAPTDGFAPAEARARVGEMTVKLVLASMREVRIFGIVSNEEKPLEDVRVIGGPPTRVSSSDPKGQYQIDISIKGNNQPYTMHFRRDGFRDQSIRLTPADLADIFDFQLNVSMESVRGLTTVTGRLKDAEGMPVVGKILNLRSSKLKTSYRAQSDIKGDFSIGGVEPGQDYQLSVRPGAEYRDYERAQLQIPDDGLKLDIVLEPMGEGELSGWMTDVNGKPIPGFALTLHSKVATGQSVQVVGDYQGFFVVDEFPEGSAVLKTNSYPIFEIQGIRASNKVEEPVEVILDMGPHTVHGRVMNGAGETVVASEVSLGWQHVVRGVQNYSARKTTADRNGNFMFTGLGSGKHTLRVNAPGFNMAVITIDVGMDPDNIVVELEEKI